jgi:hypothetical protein
VCRDGEDGAGLTVAEVRTALFALRHAWYERCTPDGPPFLFSDPAIGSLSMAEFGCMFDYGQHVKRHQRLVRSGGGSRSRGSSSAAASDGRPAELRGAASQGQVSVGPRKSAPAPADLPRPKQ